MIYQNVNHVPLLWFHVIYTTWVIVCRRSEFHVYIVASFLLYYHNFGCLYDGAAVQKRKKIIVPSKFPQSGR